MSKKLWISEATKDTLWKLFTSKIKISGNSPYFPLALKLFSNYFKTKKGYMPRPRKTPLHDPCKQGRKRVHDRKLIAEQLINWARKDSSLNLNEFCCQQNASAKTIMDWANQDPEFGEAYKVAKAYIAVRREKTGSGLLPRAYELNAAVYDLILKNHIMEIAEFEAKLKAVDVSKLNNATYQTNYQRVATDEKLEDGSGKKEDNIQILP